MYASRTGRILGLGAVGWRVAYVVVRSVGSFGRGLVLTFGGTFGD